MYCKIAITMRVLTDSRHRERRDALSHDWLSFLKQLNFDPILVPNISADPTRLIDQCGVKAIIVTGGGDVHPRRYGGKEAPTGQYSHERDQTEVAVLEWGLRRNIPILAVCRGFQLVNVYFGGRIVQGIKREIPNCLDHVGSRHEIEFIDTATRNAFKQVKTVTNSFHDDGVDSNSLGQGLVPFARTADGIIEGYYAPAKSLLSVQWHPERAESNSSPEREIAVKFLKEGMWW